MDDRNRNLKCNATEQKKGKGGVPLLDLPFWLRLCLGVFFSPTVIRIIISSLRVERLKCIFSISVNDLSPFFRTDTSPLAMAGEFFGPRNIRAFPKGYIE